MEVNEQNASEVIEIALYEGVWPVRGVELVLTHNGTCNTITTLDSTMHAMSPADRSAAVGLLIRRIHTDLLANVKFDIARQQAPNRPKPRWPVSSPIATGCSPATPTISIRPICRPPCGWRRP